jgi:hypothetical protein
MYSAGTRSVGQTPFSDRKKPKTTRMHLCSRNFQNDRTTAAPANPDRCRNIAGKMNVLAAALLETGREDRRERWLNGAMVERLTAQSAPARGRESDWRPEDLSDQASA